MIFFKSFCNVFSPLTPFKLHSHKLIIFQPSFFKALAAFASLAMLPLILFNHQSVLVFSTTKYLQFVCPSQKHPCTKITVLYFGKQYQACRAGIYHEACSEIRWHTKIFSLAFQALCSCCVCGSCCSFLFLCCVRLPYQSTNVASFSFWRNLPAGQAGTGG